MCLHWFCINGRLLQVGREGVSLRAAHPSVVLFSVHKIPKKKNELRKNEKSTKGPQNELSAVATTNHQQQYKFIHCVLASPLFRIYFLFVNARRTKNRINEIGKNRIKYMWHASTADACIQASLSISIFRFQRVSFAFNFAFMTDDLKPKQIKIKYTNFKPFSLHSLHSFNFSFVFPLKPEKLCSLCASNEIKV